jgi:hypothetical protein
MEHASGMAASQVRSVRFCLDFTGSGARVKSGRLEAFSEGVIALIITIMALELKTRPGATRDALVPLTPVLPLTPVF